MISNKCAKIMNFNEFIKITNFLVKKIFLWKFSHNEWISFEWNNVY